MFSTSRCARGVRCCAAVLAAVSLMASSAGAQTPSAGLQITIIDGEDAINNIRQRTAREPIVQVEDDNHKPIAGATVLFLLPNDGAGGAFTGGARSLTVTTDSKGQAIAHGLRPNHVSGRYQIRVQASYQGKTAQTQINQTNVAAASAAGSGSSSTAIWVGIAVAVAAGATAAIVGTRGGPTATIGTPIAISPGAGTVGAPR